MSRYYCSQIARFTTADRYMSSAGPADPQTWNRYAYIGNDPANLYDPRDLLMWVPDPAFEPSPSPDPEPGPFNPTPGSVRTGPTNPGAEPKTAFPDCNPSGIPLVEMKLNFVSQNYSAAMSEANSIQSDLHQINANLNIDTGALAVMFLQWSAGKGGFMTDPRVRAENNYFGFQQGSWGGTTIACPGSVGYTTNACFPSSMTFGQELGIALNAVSSTTHVTYLTALEQALISGSNMAGALQAIAVNGWNTSPTYGYDRTTNPHTAATFTAELDCIKAHPEYIK